MRSSTEDPARKPEAKMDERCATKARKVEPGCLVPPDFKVRCHSTDIEDQPYDREPLGGEGCQRLWSRPVRMPAGGWTWASRWSVASTPISY